MFCSLVYIYIHEKWVAYCWDWPFGECNTLQHTATHCNTLQQHTAAIHCNTRQHTKSDLRTVETDLFVNAAINLLLALGKTGIYLLGYRPRIVNGLRLYHRPVVCRSLSLSAVVCTSLCVIVLTNWPPRPVVCRSLSFMLFTMWIFYHCHRCTGIYLLGYRPRIMNELRYKWKYKNIHIYIYTHI